MKVTLESLKKAVKKKKGRSMAFAWLADFKRAAGEFDEALKCIEDGLSLYPNDIPAMLVRSKILYEKKDFAGCTKECLKVLNLDPFCLSAQKRLGDAYDQLGKTDDRNKCYRRVHDMDPLDDFWKEEYDVVSESAEDNVDLTMPDMPNRFLVEPTEEDNPFAALSEGIENANSIEDESLDALQATLNQALAQADGSDDGISEELTESNELSGTDVSSALMNIFGEEDNESTPSANASPFSQFAQEEENVAEAPAAETVVAENEENAEVAENSQSLGDAFGSIFGDDDLPEEKVADSGDEMFQKSSESSENSNDVFGSFLGNDDLSEDKPAEESGFEKSADADMSLTEDVPADKPVSVDDAFGSIFGDDDLPEEKPAEAAPAEESGFEKSADADMSLTEEAPADKPVSVDDAFGSIFGDDDLPEEKPAEAAPAEESAFEKSADADMSFDEPAASAEVAEAPAEDASEKTEAPAENDAVGDAFGSIFGDDDLPEEKPAEAAPAEESAFEKSADADLSFDEPAAPAETAAPAEGESVSDAFGSIFGDSDDLPEEKPAEAAPAEESAFEKSADADLSFDEPAAPAEVAEAPAEDASEKTEAPAENDAVGDAFGSIFGDSDDLPEEKPAEAAPAEESAFEKSADEDLSFDEPAAPAEVAEAPAADASEKTEAPAEDDAFGGAFSSIFGDSDDLPEEKPAEAALADESAFEKSADEDLSFDEPAAPAEVAEAPAADASEKTEAPAEDDAFGGAFSSMFGDSDDLPEEKPAEAALADESAFEKSADEDLSFDEPAAPAESQPQQADVANEIGGAFASMFGDEPESQDVPAEKEPSQESTGALIEEAAEGLNEAAPSTELDSLDSEVSGAFKGLFDSEEDAPSEESVPNNSGVDFLMSGDSDDEVAASLIKNPEAPLNRGAVDLDDSLNTRTLADIYMEQGVYGKAFEIYQDLLKREPDNAEIKTKINQVQKLYREKFGEDLNG